MLDTKNSKLSDESSAAKLSNTVENTALGLDSSEAGPKKTTSLSSRRSPLISPAVQLKQLADLPLTGLQNGSFFSTLVHHGCESLCADKIDIFQVNLGKLCNMTCQHCHVDAGPDRTDAMMSDETFEDMMIALEASGAHTVDVTGGAPELHPRFRDLVDRAHALGVHVIDRCNLTILQVKKFADLPAYFASKHVEVVASLPHYREANTDAQRGDNTFKRSIAALKQLNEVGYGQGDEKRRLTLMSNPSGAFLGGDQSQLEGEWKARLKSDFGVTFDRLFVLNNMPISRFLEWLDKTDNLTAYMQKLVDAFNPGAVAGLMCKNTLSISWDGRVFDCDFNQMLDIESVPHEGSATLKDFVSSRYLGRPIQTDRHCFGCTAGSGSSCGGATA